MPVTLGAALALGLASRCCARTRGIVPESPLVLYSRYAVPQRPAACADIGDAVSEWLVTHLPSWLLLIVIVACTAGTAIVVQTFVRRRFPGLRGEEHNDVTKFAFGVVGFVFAFFVGFVVSAMWGQISHADTVVRTEGAAGAQLARDSHIFDEPDRDRIRQHLLEYEQAAITEWDESNEGRTYPRRIRLSTGSTAPTRASSPVPTPKRRFWEHHSAT